MLSYGVSVMNRSFQCFVKCFVPLLGLIKPVCRLLLICAMDRCNSAMSLKRVMAGWPLSWKSGKIQGKSKRQQQKTWNLRKGKSQGISTGCSEHKSSKKRNEFKQRNDSAISLNSVISQKAQ